MFPWVRGTFSVLVVLRCEDQPLPPGRGASAAQAGSEPRKGWCCLGPLPPVRLRPFLTRGPSRGPGVGVLSLRSHIPAAPFPSCRHSQFASTHTMLLSPAQPSGRFQDAVGLLGESATQGLRSPQPWAAHRDPRHLPSGLAPLHPPDRPAANALSCPPPCITTAALEPAAALASAALEKGTDINAYSSLSCVRLGVAGSMGRGVCGGVGQCPALPSRAGLEAVLACKLAPINKQVVPANAVESL